MSRKKENRRMTVILTGICVMFMSIAIYLSYFEMFKADDIKNNQANGRLWQGEDKILRGQIRDRNGEVLAYSEIDEDGLQKRFYKYGYNYGNLIGYSHKSYGKSGVESSFNAQLLNVKNKNPIKELSDLLKEGDINYGNDVVLTIDNRLQTKAFELLGDRRGSVVVMDNLTGEVYAMASTPSFDPNNLEKQWTTLVEDTNSPLINRSTSGLYPPGSIFKIITSVGIIEDLDPEEVLTTGSKLDINGYTLRNYGSIDLGSQNLREAFTDSSNTYFGTQGMNLGKERLVEIGEDFLLNKKIDFDIPVSKSKINTENMSDQEIAVTAIGQGKTLATPLNMLMMGSSIANDGEIVQPKLVKEVLDIHGKVKESWEPEFIGESCPVNVAGQIKEDMINVVKNGTGQGARLSNYTMAGKTGTAENGTELSHAWFVGFAPAENPKFSVIVLLENVEGSSSKTASPIAKTIMEEALNIYGGE